MFWVCRNAMNISRIWGPEPRAIQQAGGQINLIAVFIYSSYDLYPWNIIRTNWFYLAHCKNYIQLKMLILKKVWYKFKQNFHGCKNISLSLETKSICRLKISGHYFIHNNETVFDFSYLRWLVGWKLRWLE